MNNLLDYLNNNSGAITVVFTAVVALSTVVYAWLTSVLVKETMKIREVQTEPLIEIIIEPLEEAINIIRLRIKNIGLGPAKNVSFKSSVLKGGEGAEKLLLEFTDVNFFKKGLTYLGPNQQVHSRYTQMAKNHEEKIKSVFQFDIKYESITGKPYNETAIIDMSEMIGMCQLGTPNLYSIAKSLENIQRILEHVTSGFKKIKTDIYTHTDREKEQELRKQLIEESKVNQKDSDL
jgi:hypothetical protein